MSDYGEAKDGENNMAFWVRGFAIADNYIYYPDNQLGKLIKMEAVSMKVIGSYALSERCDNEMGYSDCINCDPYIVIIPWFATSIKIFDIRSEKIKMYPIKQGEDPKFHTALRQGNKVILIPFFYKEIVEIDIESGMINYHDILKDEMYRNENVLFYSGIIGQNGNLFLPSFSGNDLFVYDLENQEINKLTIGENNIYLVDVTEDQAYIYILAHYAPGIYIYEKKTKKCEYKQVFETDMSQDYFANIYDCGSYLFLAQRMADYSYIYEKNSGKFEKVDLYGDLGFSNKIIDRIKPFCDDQIILLCENQGGMLGIWNIKSRSVEWKYIDSIAGEFMKKYLDRNGYIIEDQQYTLRLFLNSV